MLTHMKKFSVLLVAISAAVLITGFSTISRASDDDREAARKLLQSGEILPLETILEKARAIQPGQVLEVEFESKRERYLYELEILDEAGVVYELKLDARTGELLKRERED